MKHEPIATSLKMYFGVRQATPLCRCPLQQQMRHACGSRIERLSYKSRVSAALHPHGTLNRHK